MAKNVEDLSIEEIEAKIADLNKQKDLKLKGENVEAVVTLLKEADPDTVKDILDVLKGLKTISGKGARKTRKSRGEGAPKAPKTELTLKGGKVFFGAQEITHTKVDKKGVLRIAKEGKGLPPTVESQPEEVKAALLKLPKK